jgi:hypothetical protein
MAGYIGDHIADTSDCTMPAPDQVRDQTGPARLMTRAKPGAVIALEVLVK